MLFNSYRAVGYGTVVSCWLVFLYMFYSIRKKMQYLSFCILRRKCADAFAVLNYIAVYQFLDCKLREIAAGDKV